jgi:hypothetical protein
MVCTTVPSVLDRVHEMEEPAVAEGLGIFCAAQLLQLDAVTAKLLSCETDRPPLLGLASCCKQLMHLVSQDGCDRGAQLKKQWT